MEFYAVCRTIRTAERYILGIIYSVAPVPHFEVYRAAEFFGFGACPIRAAVAFGFKYRGEGDIFEIDKTVQEYIGAAARRAAKDGGIIVDTRHYVVLPEKQSRFFVILVAFIIFKIFD